MKVDMEYLKERVLEKMETIKGCDAEMRHDELKKLEKTIIGLEKVFDITTHEQTEELLEMVEKCK